MRNINSCLVVAMYLTFSLFLSLLPLNSYASESIYTIQTGSFISIAPAQKQFDSIVQGLNEKELDYLRIEKIGKFYSVRLGKFEDYATAKKFLQAIKPQLSTAIIMKAYIIDERTVRLYKKSPSAVGSLEEQIKIISDLVDKEDYEGALEVIKIEMLARPESPELNGWYGAVLLRMNDPAKAIKYLRKAAKLSPEVSDYHNGVGYSLFFLGRLDEAIDEFNKAVTLNPAHIDALTGLGIAYAKIGKKDKAIDVYNKLKDVDRDTANNLLKIIKGAAL